MCKKEINLLPCPFCGGEAEVDISGGNFHWWIVCVNCGVGTAIYNTKAEALTAWNTRADTRWIKVTDRLPDRKGLYCVLWHNINDGNIQLRTCQEHIFDKNDTWGFTHWQPIILPKGDS